MHEPLPPPELIPWLTFPGSFMQRCRQNGIPDPRVQVLYQGWQRPSPTERLKLGLPFRSSIWVRDVLIESDAGQWMLARSAFPHQTLRGPERQLARLKSRPLGAVLFRHPLLQRSPFEFFCLSPAALWKQFHQQVETPAFARRSLFTLRQKTLLLTEVFLPDLERRLRLPQSS